MDFKKKILLISFFSIFLPLNGFALTIPAKPGGYVNDYAGLLSKEATYQIAGNLRAYENETSNQIIVAIFKSLEGESLEDFSVKLATKWKVGTKNKDNGVLLIIFKDEKKVRIEVGYGLEGALTDATSSEIIRNQIVPNFKTGNFDKGISDGVSAIINVTKSEYKASAKKTTTQASDTQGMLAFLLLLFFILPIIAYIALIVIGISFLGFPVGLIAALGIIAVLEFVRRILSKSLFGETFFNSGRGGWYGGSGFGGGSFGGGGFSGFSGGGGSFGGGGSSGNW
jgi:uncharacterized protein